MSAWIKSQRLWQLAEKKAAEERPRFTAAFYRRTVEVYVELGGKLLEDEPELDPGESDEL